MATGDGIFQRSDRDGWYVSYVDAKGARKKKRVQASTRKQAETILSGIKAKVEHERIFGSREVIEILTATFFERFLKYQRAHLRPASYDREATVVRLILPTLPETLDGITKASCAAWMADRLGTGRAPATIAKEATTLKHALRLAVEWDVLESNPAERLRLPKASAGRTRYLTPPELKNLLERAEEWMRGPIALAAFTGMRRGEVLGLTWADVDLDRGQMYLRETKNGTLRIVPINEMARRVLEHQAERKGLVFPRVDAHLLTVRTRRLMKKLGIVGASFHSLRHTAASHLVMNGIDLYTVGHILGHKTPRMTQRYAHLSPGFVSKAVAALDGVFGDAAGTLERTKEAECLPKPVRAASRKHQRRRGLQAVKPSDIGTSGNPPIELSRR